MKPVTIEPLKIKIKNKEIPFISGEVHYWRMNPLYWEKCLARTKEMGIDIIASYICWEFHEYEENKFDFSGETNASRNLIRFLDLMQENGFWIIIRPGPYIYSEWAQAGIPERFSHLHRMHPDFLNAAKLYMKDVVEALKPYFVSNGGNIFLFQADNEIDPFCQTYGNQLGLYGGEGLFQEFLVEKYGYLQEINKCWDTKFEHISHIKANAAPVIKNDSYQRQYLDFREFRQWFTNKKAKWMIDTYRDLGVDIPIYVNTFPNCAIQNWRQLTDIADLVGIDQYPTNEFQHIPDELFTFYKNVSYAASVLKVPYIAEFESGIWHGWHYDTKMLTANHYRMACLTALAGGIVGWNWYMLVDRDNWYMSPINPKGYKRPELFESFQKIVHIFKTVEPSFCKKLTNVAVTYNENHLAAEQFGSKNSVMKALYEADVSFVVCDLLRKNSCDKQILFYNGPHWLDKQEQQQLKQFVETGGHLICFQTFPYLDENLNSLNLLDIQLPQGTALKKTVKLDLGDEHLILESSLFDYTSVPGEPIVAEQTPAKNIFQEESAIYENLEVGSSFTIGYIQSSGKGKISVFGCEPSVNLITAILKSGKCELFSHSSTPNILTTLFKKENKYYLIIINESNEDKAAKVQLSASIFANKKWEYVNLMTNISETINFNDNPFITIDLAKKDGIAIEFKPKK